MISHEVEQELHHQLEILPLGKQRQVLDFARGLSQAQPTGVASASLLHFAGTIDPADLVIMSKAANEDCEQINPQDW